MSHLHFEAFFNESTDAGIVVECVAVQWLMVHNLTITLPSSPSETSHEYSIRLQLALGVRCHCGDCSISMATAMQHQILRLSHGDEPVAFGPLDRVRILTMRLAEGVICW